MDALDALSSGSGSSLSGSDTEGGEDGGAGRGPGSLAPEQPGGAAAAAGAGSKKKARVEITVDDLTRAGYSGGPSVLFMKAPDEGGQTDWAWCVSLAGRG